MSKYTYEDSVSWLREQPQYSEMVKLCYLDENNLTAAKRFSFSEEFTEVIKFLRIDNIDKKLKILDIGCGNGIASYAFASLGHEVYAIDPDESEDVGLGATKKLASVVSNGSISTHQAFAESLPFADATFDIIYARQALHHFTDLRKGLSECSRVLKPKGLLLATREHVVSNNEQLKTFLDEHLLHKLHGGENAYLLKDYILAIEQSGIIVLNLLAPFDTVINHFPLSNLDLKNLFFERLAIKIGELPAKIISKLPYIEKFYRHYLSQNCNHPGRPYSFLGSKQEIK
ncbi:class I SAM-dependent methyltransferase [Chlorogloea sp. CCALA 695]|uniref:class I SAM-dependent methyltransferase n=1 Tax=Chlorogloea sp. CCALA 695 TaxID=2107693 RepID=UPI000D069C75|nr:methyltransferase domain-containing protein [Chlorogloea sp. CCALA 695]PSB32748.1 SAM-dependent methyltransferase [Chlorogloea sp. CCALA 695]